MTNTTWKKQSLCSAPDESPDKFAQRQSGWEERMECARGKAEVIVAKQRHGPVGIRETCLRSASLPASETLTHITTSIDI